MSESEITEKILEMVKEFTNWSDEKCQLWLDQPNYFFDGFTPRELIAKGDQYILVEFFKGK